MKADVSIQQNEHMLLNNLLIIFLQLHTKVLLNRPPDRTWRRPPGYPQNKWLDQLRNDSTRPTGDLWRRAVAELSMGWVDPWVGSRFFSFWCVGLGPLQQKY